MLLKSLSMVLVMGLGACSHLPKVSEVQTNFVAFGDSGFGNDNQKN